LANVVKKEIEAIDGAKNVKLSGSAAVLFESDSARVGLEALLWTRATHRIMEFVAAGSDIETREDVYNFIQREVDVKDLLGDGKGSLLTLNVHVVLTNARDIPPDINHSHYSALTIKNALVDKVRDLRGDRPNVDIESADVPLICTIRGAGSATSVSLYKCLHNGSLHRRGYRQGAIHKASMKESMAAGLLMATGHDFTSPSLRMCDPMAGSGSLLLEGAMMAADLAPGLMRIKCGMSEFSTPPVLTWKSDHENLSQIWKDLLLEAAQRAKTGLQRLRSSPEIKIVANDAHPGALDLLEDSLYQAGLQNIVEVQQGDCQDFIPPSNSLVVTNPPWGVRLTETMSESWESLRVFLRQNCAPGTEAWVLCGDKDATKHLGLRRSQSFVLQTGQQDLRWLQYMILDKSELQNKSDREIKPQSTQHAYERTRPTQTRDRTPGQSNRGRREDDPTRGYERRKRVVRYDNKSETKPLTQAEREEKKNSWYI
jgi:putative N6-adenine-specific DNA methylase